MTDRVEMLRTSSPDIPPESPSLWRRACTSTRGAVLRGVVLALAPLPFALLSDHDGPQLVGAAVIIATMSAAVVVAALVERALARKQAMVAGVLAVLSVTALSVPIGVAQGLYAEAVLRGGGRDGLAKIEALTSGNEVGTFLGLLIASVVRTLAEENNAPAIVAFTLGAPLLPGLAAIALACWIGDALDRRLGRESVR